MPAYDAFATAAVNVAFPTWFYSAWAIAGLHPLVRRSFHQTSGRQVREAAAGGAAWCWWARTQSVKLKAPKALQALALRPSAHSV